MRIYTILLRYAVSVPTLLFLAVGAGGQSLNVDLDIFAGDPSNGNGAPSSSFGAAAAQPGYWNRTRAGSSPPQSLFDLVGQPTTVVMTVPVGAGSAGGSNYPINTGDYALLLNDYADIPDQMVFRFSGLMPGAYTVWTYAVNASGHLWPVDVSVDGAVPPNPQRVTGPMPGNSFQYLSTHSVHSVPSLNGDLVIRLSSPWPRGKVNGFQIVAVVPEPASLTVLSCLLAFAVRRRRRL